MATRRIPLTAKLKLQRSTVHYRALQAEIENFFKPDVDPPVFNFEPGSDKGSIPIHFRIKKPLPLEWSVIVGDCLYNLRSALDHIVSSLILMHGGKLTNRNEFPIFFKRDNYFEIDTKGKPTGRIGGLTKVKGLPDGAATAIEALQPYNGKKWSPDLHPLWLLHELSNHDKHRLVNVVHAAITSGYVSVSGLGHGKVERFTIPLGHLEDGTEVTRIRPMLGVRPESEVNVNFKFVPGVSFSPKGPGRGLPILQTLRDIHTIIQDDILLALGPFVK